MKYGRRVRHPELLTSQLVKLRRSVTQRWLHGCLWWPDSQSAAARLEAALEDSLELVHGPGCPVCVTPAEAMMTRWKLRSVGRDPRQLGDMLRVLDARQSVAGQGFWSRRPDSLFAVDAVQLAANAPNRHIVFFGVGFETTAPHGFGRAAGPADWA